ncbi:unnamed protein product [Rotaria magnacalcarata]|uniref:SH3 domain-containing protein n=1 Tax=Rotaria magnacalcarata TaxID=392030 RepID=A0A814SNS3_9BILA|nr:unnamed protein product [Rotaria magnacalcarata]CAF2256842.1 unnamed protein product [Rotaria magnacalcarata]CAF3884711.1 unnamed protein product [Rotaria magnacalcarata]CAF3950130.1 unnamed protein product [Rotaria magnacalcarata]CAF4054656.1 unnamed protein product [Rotaria magnacalcarata]
MLVKAKLSSTIVKVTHLAKFGIDQIGCAGCTSQQGLIDCETSLPVICIRYDYTARPPYYIYGNGAAMPAQYYRGWGQGHIASTPLVKGSKFHNYAQMNAFCASMVGDGWQAVSGPNWSKWIPGMNGTKYSGREWTANAAIIQQGGWDFYAYENLHLNLISSIQYTINPMNACHIESNTKDLIYVANYDFNGTTMADELNFRRGDRLKILDKCRYNNWWQAKSIRTKQIGHVPVNYISLIVDNKKFEWYFTDTNRRAANQFLEQSHNGKDTF